MNEEKQIRYSKYLVISFALIAVLIIFFKLFCGGSSGNNNDVQGTVQRIADDNKQTGKSVGTAADELERAEEANRRAAFILSEDKERANACAGIIVELQKNNSRAKQILADVEHSNKTRKVQK